MGKKKSKKAEKPLADAGSGLESSKNAGNSTEEVSDWEYCDHHTGNNSQLHKQLMDILYSNQIVSCKHCPKAGGQEGSVAKAKPEKSDIWVCLQCHRHYCGGLISDSIPYGHARRHARQERHSWLASYDHPYTVFCASCKHQVHIKSIKAPTPPQPPVAIETPPPAATSPPPPATPPAEAARTPPAAPDKVIGSDNNTLVLANTHGSVVKGLPNLGNTCFFNVVLQSLLAIDMFRTKMLGPDVPAGPIAMFLHKLFVETSASNDSGAELNPADLFSSFCSEYPQFKGNKMQDSHELLRRFLDCLMKDATRAGVPNFINSVFEGEICSMVSGISCPHWSDKYENFHDIVLPVPSKKSSAKSVSVVDCLNTYTETEELSELWHCEQCSVAPVDPKDPSAKECKKGEEMAASASDRKGSEEMMASGNDDATMSCSEKKDIDEITATDVCSGNANPLLAGKAHKGNDNQNNQRKDETKVYKTARRTINISKTPPVLTLVFNRFIEVSPVQFNKLEGHLSFEEKLNIRMFMDPRSQENDSTYQLVAVVEHIGTVTAGHYVAYVRSGKIGGRQQQSHNYKSWFRASDSNVRETSLEEVLECEAYILFYERVKQHNPIMHS